MTKSLRFSVLAILCAVAAASFAAETPTPRIVTHDNRVAAGVVRHGVLTIQLEIRKGEWYPEAEDGPHVTVYAFAEAGKAPMIPGPLIRVTAGTHIRASVRNTLDLPLELHGFQTHPSADAPVTIPAGEQRTFEFDAGAPGTYYYWAASPGMTLTINTHRFGEQTQLSGAFLVDGPDARPSDRIFVLGLWRDYPDREHPVAFTQKEFGTINGKSWPYTERMKFRVGDEAVWHWVNSSAVNHPMHMHGSYFDVLSRGNWNAGAIFPAEMRPRVVTEFMRPGSTMTMRWVPPSPGHWLFHCHLLAHISTDSTLSAIQGHESHGSGMHMGMAGIVLGLDVAGAPKIVPASTSVARALTLDLETAAVNPLQVRINLRDGAHESTSTELLGPPIVLKRGEPVAITVVNHLPEATAIHWHGIELESYYDGVPGFSGVGQHITPQIPPGGQFVARMTPPRAGTFIYHTHWHDIGQLRGGLNGALLVVDDSYDPSSEQVFVTALGTSNDRPLILNGSDHAPELSWEAGKTYHVRLINIGPNVPVEMSLTQSGQRLQWTFVGKDGMELPKVQRVTQPSSMVLAVGETYDFEVQAPASGEVTARAFVPAVPGLTPQMKAEQRILIH